MQQPLTQREYWSGKVGDEWALQAERIDAMLAPLTGAVLDLAAFRPGERVLDIGCGAGQTSIEIARRVGASGSAVGVDLSLQLLALARSRAEEAGLAVEFVEADAGDAPLGAPFDAAFSRFGIMFFEAPTQAFAHVRTHMRANGRLIFACWRALGENLWTTIPLEAIAPMLKSPLAPPDPDAPGPYALADAAKINRILGEAGWRDIALTPWDGRLAIAGGGSLEDAADFLLKIGPCARAIADQHLDAAEAKQRVIERASPLYAQNAVTLPVACWLVAAKA